MAVGQGPEQGRQRSPRHGWPVWSASKRGGAMLSGKRMAVGASPPCAASKCRLTCGERQGEEVPFAANLSLKQAPPATLHTAIQCAAALKAPLRQAAPQHPCLTSSGTSPLRQPPGSGSLEDPHTLMNTFRPCSLTVFTTKLQGGEGEERGGRRNERRALAAGCVQECGNRAAQLMHLSSSACDATCQADRPRTPARERPPVGP